MSECEHKWHFYEESIDGCFCVSCRGRLGRGKAEAMLNEYAALKRGIVEYAAMKQYLRAGPDGSTKPMWHDVDEEEKERYRESVRDVLLTAEEQE